MEAPSSQHGTTARSTSAGYTDMAQQFAQMMQALAQGQNQLQRAMAEAYAQQMAITRNIATSAEVRDRSDLKGVPKPDSLSGQIGTWDS